MFTGLIQHLGRVISATSTGRAAQLLIEPTPAIPDLETGESIAVDGVCLTVTQHSPTTIAFDVSPETLDRTTLGRLGAGDRVHLERALRLADRLGGHLVLGHVDGVGQLLRSRPEGNATHLTFSAPPEVAPYLAPKGCIAVDGVSLTLNHCTADAFTVTIIPHTAELTKLGSMALETPVNLEADIIGKYVAGLLAPRLAGSGNARDEG